MKINTKKLKKDNRVKIMGALIFAVVLFVALQQGGFLQTGGEETRPLFDYGTVTYKKDLSSGMTTLNAGDTINTGIYSWNRIQITFTWTATNVEKISADGMYLALYKGTSSIVQSIATLSGNVYTGLLDLDACPEGTFDYYIKIYGISNTSFFYSGNSFTFTVINGEPSYDDPVFVETQVDKVDVTINQAQFLIWKFDYIGAYTATLKMNSVIVDTEDNAAQAGIKDYAYMFTPTQPGTEYSFELSIVPDASGVDTITDVAVVETTGTPPTPTTTTPTTPTTTTPTTTPTTPTTTTPTTPGWTPTPPPPEMDFTTIIIFVGFGISGIVVVFIIQRRGSGGM